MNDKKLATEQRARNKSHHIKNSEKAQACIRNLKPNSRRILRYHRSLCTFFVLKNEQQKDVGMHVIYIYIFEKENQTNYSTRKAIVCVSHIVMNVLYYVSEYQVSSVHINVASVSCIVRSVLSSTTQTDR